MSAPKAYGVRRDRAYRRLAFVAIFGAAATLVVAGTSVWRPFSGEFWIAPYRGFGWSISNTHLRFCYLAFDIPLGAVPATLSSVVPTAEPSLTSAQSWVYFAWQQALPFYDLKGGSSMHTRYSTFFGLPLWMPLGFFIVVLIHCRMALGSWKFWRGTRTGYCPNCGYDLMGNISGVCPECGMYLRSSDKLVAVPNKLREVE